MSTAELQPSKLGTKEHWDSVYEEEFDNFEEIGDEGEIWFGVESVEKMVEWAIEHVPPSPDTSILEIGSGNGTLLFALVDAGYASEQLSGIDYSAGSIKLAQAIAKTRGAENITFNLCDFLKEDPPLLPQNSQDSRHAAWDLIMDKGTFDAIALMKPDEDGNAPVANYPRHIAELLKPGCLYLITSCNFTEEELTAKFVTPKTGLQYHSRIQHPTYTFGGKSGSICSSVAFKKPEL